MKLSDDNLKDARILIVDDGPANVMALEGILEQAGYTNLESTLDSRQALPRFLANPPDLLLLDVRMPHLDGFTIIHQLRHRIPENVFLPIVILTADVTHETRRRALQEGAADFLPKPLNMTEVLLRIRNLLRTRYLHIEVQ